MHALDRAFWMPRLTWKSGWIPVWTGILIVFPVSVYRIRNFQKHHSGSGSTGAGFSMYPVSGRIFRFRLEPNQKWIFLTFMNFHHNEKVSYHSIKFSYQSIDFSSQIIFHHNGRFLLHIITFYPYVQWTVYTSMVYNWIPILFRFGSGSKTIFSTTVNSVESIALSFCL